MTILDTEIILRDLRVAQRVTAVEDIRILPTIAADLVRDRDLKL
jgi:hypothetical protein